MSFKTFVACLSVCCAVLVFSSCQSQKNGMENVRSLAQALKDRGINYTSIKEVKKKGQACPDVKIDDEIELAGDNVSMLILKVSAQESLDKLTKMLGIGLAMLEMRSEKGSAQAVVSQPFVVISVKEPSPGALERAMKEIFPTSQVRVVRASAEGYEFVEQLKKKLLQKLESVLK